MAFDWAKKWLFDVFLKKALKRGIQIVVAFLASSKFQEMGVSVDETTMAAGIWTLLEASRQWLKVKTSWSWL